MSELEALYGEVNNLSGLVHPAWHRQFAYMSSVQALRLAEDIAVRIIESGRKVVVVSETGAAPLAELISRVAGRRGVELTIVPVKFPRRLSADKVRGILLSFIPPGLAQSDIRREKLAALCAAPPPAFFESPDVMALLDSLLPCAASQVAQGVLTCASSNSELASFQNACAELFQDLPIGLTLAEPFVYLDEYIDSGTTFGNALKFLRCLTPEPDIVTASYYVRPAAAGKHASVLYLRATSEDRPGCFDDGAYPFENRVDLIGHFYSAAGGHYRRVEVSELCSMATSGADGEEAIDKFIASMREALVGLVSDSDSDSDSGSGSGSARFLGRFSEPQVRRGITPEHCLRFAIWALERRRAMSDPDLGPHSNSECAEFLFQLFDMYGPAWTPMPVAFHFDFWTGFGLESESLCSLEPEAILPEITQFAASYEALRAELIGRAAKLCMLRREAWLREIDQSLEVCYG